MPKLHIILVHPMDSFSSVEPVLLFSEHGGDRNAGEPADFLFMSFILCFSAFQDPHCIGFFHTVLLQNLLKNAPYGAL